MNGKWLGVCALLAWTVGPATAEPIGRWFSGFGQGTVEYGIKNDSAGSDYFYIACTPEGAQIRVTVGGKDASPGTDVIITIGAEEFELFTSADGWINTESHVADGIFRSLWEAIRSGSVMRVRLPTGQSAPFTLRGTAEVMPKDPCLTGFAA